MDNAWSVNWFDSGNVYRNAYSKEIDKVKVAYAKRLKM